MEQIEFMGPVTQIMIVLGDTKEGPRALFRAVRVVPQGPGLPPAEEPLEEWEAKHLAAKALMLQFNEEQGELDKHPKLMIARAGLTQ